MGTQRALELMFTGRRVTAEEALDIGAVLEVVEPTDHAFAAVREQFDGA